jgi:hypothetical protein
MVPLKLSFVLVAGFGAAYYFQPVVFLPSSDNERHHQLRWFIPVVGYLIWEI